MKPLIAAWLFLATFEGFLLVTTTRDQPLTVAVAILLASAVAWVGGVFSVRLFDTFNRERNMPAQTKPKATSGKARNDKRSNGKASKTGVRGSRRTPITELHKVLLGGGAYKRIERPAPEKPQVAA